MTAISSTDASAHFLHVHAPRIYKVIQGDLIKIVGTTRDVYGELGMVTFPIKNLKFFAIMVLTYLMSQKE